MMWLSLLLALGLALVHLYSSRLRFLQIIPRSRWLSAAGGVSVAYVFIHILPDLDQHQATIARMAGLAFLEHHVYLLALLGVVIFYGLERLALISRQQNQKQGGGDVTDQRVFWLHIASFSLYNALIGYLLIHREQPGLRSLIFFFVALALHFVVNDNGLREHHKQVYHRRGRWILAAAVILGWAIGQSIKIDEALVAVLFAFLAGGIILNVLKEELPEEQESRFWPFAAGAAAYSALLLVT